MKVLSIDYNSVNAPQKLVKSIRETGFAVIKNHPLDTNLIDSIYSEWQWFFSSTKKNKYIFREIEQDGYFPFMSENAKNREAKDLKEFFHIYPWGAYPNEISDNTNRFYSELLSLGIELLNWIEVNTPKDISSQFSMPLDQMVKDSDQNLLRIIHYPPTKNKIPLGSVRAAPHEDINLITLLCSGSQPGLQALDMDGNWHDIACDPNSIVINSGDMLNVCSNGYYPSTTHQVINPINNELNVSRMSSPLFLHPNEEVILSKDYTAGSYLLERLKELGLK